MNKQTRRKRRLAVAAVGLTAACALVVPSAAQAAASYTPNPNQWYFSTWNIQQEVWPVSQGAGVTVAVLDSGVQASLPDLRGVVEPGADELGDPGNGEQDYAPDNGHGTTVAVLIAGQGYGTGVIGIAPQAKILPVHVAYPTTSSNTPIANGIKYAADHGAAVINLSVGQPAMSATSCDPVEQEAVSYALAHNVVVVSAAGDTNTGSGSAPTEPASCAGVLAVGAVEPNGSLWSGSTQGPNVTVAAPGDHMTGIGLHGGYSTDASGTSFSAPLVSAAAALIRSKYPSMPWYTVVQRLTDTAIPSGPVPNDGTGYGIIDIHKALDVAQYPLSTTAPNPVYTRYQAYLKNTGQTPSTPAPSATASSSGTSTLIYGLIAIAVIAILALVIISATRKRPH